MADLWIYFYIITRDSEVMFSHSVFVSLFVFLSMFVTMFVWTI